MIVTLELSGLGNVSDGLRKLVNLMVFHVKCLRGYSALVAVQMGKSWRVGAWVVPSRWLFVSLRVVW